MGNITLVDCLELFVHAEMFNEVSLKAELLKKMRQLAAAAMKKGTIELSLLEVSHKFVNLPEEALKRVKQVFAKEMSAESRLGTCMKRVDSLVEYSRRTKKMAEELKEENDGLRKENERLKRKRESGGVNEPEAKRRKTESESKK